MPTPEAPGARPGPQPLLAARRAALRPTSVWTSVRHRVGLAAVSCTTWIAGSLASPPTRRYRPLYQSMPVGTQIATALKVAGYPAGQRHCPSSCSASSGGAQVASGAVNKLWSQLRTPLWLDARSRRSSTTVPTTSPMPRQLNQLPSAGRARSSEIGTSIFRGSGGGCSVRAESNPADRDGQDHSVTRLDPHHAHRYPAPTATSPRRPDYPMAAATSTGPPTP